MTGIKKTPKKPRAENTWSRQPDETGGAEMRRLIDDINHITGQDDPKRMRYTVLLGINTALEKIAQTDLDYEIQKERESMLALRRKALRQKRKKNSSGEKGARQKILSDFLSTNLVLAGRIFDVGAYHIPFSLETMGVDITVQEVTRLPGFQLVLKACRDRDVDLNMVGDSAMGLQDPEEDEGTANQICDPLFSAFNVPDNTYAILLSFNLAKSFDAQKWAPYMKESDRRLVPVFALSSDSPSLERGRIAALQVVHKNKKDMQHVK